MNPLALRRAQSTLAGAAGLAGAFFFWANLGGDPKPIVWVPVVGLALAALAAQLPSLGAQLVARGLWWSNLALGALLCCLSSRSDADVGLPLALGGAAALLLADRRALTAAAERAGFRPVAFPGTIQLLLVLALADAPTLSIFAYLEHARAHDASALALAAAAVALLVGFVGLYRLALWGALTTAGASLALGAALAGGLVRTVPNTRTALLALSALQVLVALPMLYSLATRTALPAPSARARRAAAMACVAALGAAAAVGFAHGHR